MSATATVNWQCAVNGLFQESPFGSKHKESLSIRRIR